MKRENWILTGLALAAFLLAAVNLIGADNTAPKEVPEPSTAAAWERRLADFNSDNLPLDEIVKELRRKFPELNYIVKEKARSQPVSLMLRAVTLDEFLKALEAATDGRVHVIWPTNNGDRLIIFDKGRGSGTAIDPATGLPMPGGEEKICRVFNLSKYLGRTSDKSIDAAIKEVVDSLETAWSMLRQANGDQEEIPKLNLHRGTKLLIAVGRREDLDILEQVVKELQGSGPGSDDIASKPAYYRLRLDLMRERATQAEALTQLGLAQEEFKRAQDLYKDKILSEAQYQTKRAAVESLKAAIYERSNILERLDADLKNFALPDPGRGVRSSGKE